MLRSTPTFILFQLNSLLDTGRYGEVSIEDVRDAIRAGRVDQFLTDLAGDDLDFSIVDRADWDEFHAEWQDMAGAISARRKFGVENNGLCLLIAYLTERVQRSLAQAYPTR